MAYTCVYNNIIFIEGQCKIAEYGPFVECDLSFKFGAQLKSIRDVKANLALQAQSKGYNAVACFIYGQKARLLAIDDVAFWGKGLLARLPKDDYKRIIEGDKNVLS